MHSARCGSKGREEAASRANLGDGRSPLDLPSTLRSDATSPLAACLSPQSGPRGLPNGRRQTIRMPAIVAVIQEAMAPPSIAFRPTLARSALRPGATAEMPPIWMPIEEKLAKPQSA